MLLGQHCSWLSTILFSIATPYCGLIQAQQFNCSILLTTKNNVAPTTLLYSVFNNLCGCVVQSFFSFNILQIVDFLYSKEPYPPPPFICPPLSGQLNRIPLRLTVVYYSIASAQSDHPHLILTFFHCFSICAFFHGSFNLICAYGQVFIRQRKGF